MLPNFLCPTHRRYFQQNPIEAVSAWDSWMCQGHQFALNQDLAKAFSYYGSSMEVAEILMQQGANKPLNAITAFERYQLAGQHLAKLCQRNSHHDMANTIVKKLNNTLANQGTPSSTTKPDADAEYNYLEQQPISNRIH